MIAAKRLFLFLLGLVVPLAMGAIGLLATIEPRPALALTAPTCCCPAALSAGSEVYAGQNDCRWMDLESPATPTACPDANPGPLPAGFTYWANPADQVGACGSQTAGGASQSISFGLQNPLKAGIDTPEKLIVLVAQAFVGILGLYAVMMFIYGGYMMIFSGGSSEAIQKGKDTMLWAVIGIVIGFLSVAIINFFLSRIPAA